MSLREPAVGSVFLAWDHFLVLIELDYYLKLNMRYLCFMVTFGRMMRAARVDVNGFSEFLWIEIMVFENRLSFNCNALIIERLKFYKF